MKGTIRLLQIEDVPTDAELCVRELKRAGMRCESRRVENESDFLKGLSEFRPDAILCDFSMPHFDGMQALAIAAQDHSDIPFIFVSGTLGEEYAVRALQNGATDYVLKTNLVRLPVAVQRAVDEAEKRRASCLLDRRLKESEAGLSRAQSMAKLAHIITGLDGAFETWSETLPHLLGVTHEQVPTSTRAWLAILHPEDRAFFRGKSIEAAVTGKRVDVGYRLRHDKGDWIHVEQVIEPLEVLPHTNAPKQWFCTLQDVTEQKRSEERIKRLNRVHAVLSAVNSAIVRLRVRQELFKETCRVIVERGGFSVGWIAVLDHASGKLMPVAHAGLPDDFAAGFGSSRGLIPVGASEQALRERQPAFDNDIARDPEIAGTESEPTAKGVRRAAIRMGAKSVIVLPLFVQGKTFGALTLYAPEQDFFDDSEIKLLSELAGDISFALEYIEKEERLNYLAYYDPLTGLANRTLFHDRLNQFVQTQKEGTGRVAAILVNLDRFSHLNEKLGRHAGDKLLKMIAKRLSEALREPSSLARIGGDSFALAIASLKHDEEVANVLEERIFGRLNQPFQLEGEDIRIAAKAGVALCPDDGNDAETLFRNAEVALKGAKALGDPYLLYAPQMNARVAEKVTLENQLRQAVEREEFVLHYQPKVRLSDGQVCGIEALIRWNHPEMGLVPPGRFIPLLEETGLILEVGSWALMKAVSDYQDLSTIGCPRIAVNVSPLELRRKDFVSRVGDIIGRSKPGQSHGLDVEITETVIMENIEKNITQLRALREMGVKVAVDDFGTGYSSLAYISRLPVDTLKVDRSFVHAMERNPEDLSIVSTIITLAHALKLNVIAEGVETETQRNLLVQMRCDEMQGYLYSPPVPIAQIEGLLRRLQGYPPTVAL